MNRNRFLVIHIFKNTTSEYALQVGKLLISYAKQPMIYSRLLGDQLLTKIPIELKDDY